MNNTQPNPNYDKNQQAVEKLILLAGGSQSDLSRLLKINRANVSRWLNHTKKIPAERIFEIIKAFKTIDIKLSVADIRPDLDD